MVLPYMLQSVGEIWLSHRLQTLSRNSSCLASLNTMIHLILPFLYWMEWMAMSSDLDWSFPYYYDYLSLLYLWTISYNWCFMYNCLTYFAFPQKFLCKTIINFYTLNNSFWSQWWKHNFFKKMKAGCIIRKKMPNVRMTYDLIKGKMHISSFL